MVWCCAPQETLPGVKWWCCAAQWTLLWVHLHQDVQLPVYSLPCLVINLPVHGSSRIDDLTKAAVLGDAAYTQVVHLNRLSSQGH